jgi:hypothetical protein
MDGLNSSNARSIRLGENALFHLPAQSVVVRFARTVNDWEYAANEFTASRWLANLRFPVAQEFQVVQPINVSGHSRERLHTDGRPGSALPDE